MGKKIKIHTGKWDMRAGLPTARYYPRTVRVPILLMKWNKWKQYFSSLLFWNQSSYYGGEKWSFNPHTHTSGGLYFLLLHLEMADTLEPRDFWTVRLDELLFVYFELDHLQNQLLAWALLPNALAFPQGVRWALPGSLELQLNHWFSGFRG